jgi:outer membrane protein OmpA-like peptidoglycan-associated protein
VVDPSIGQNRLGAAVGDLRAFGKYAFFPRLNPLQLAVSLTAVAPTGNTQTLRGGGAFMFSPRVDFELNLTVLKVLVNAGANLRTANQRLLNLTIGQELAWAVGAEVPVWNNPSNRLALIATTTGGLGLTQLNASSVPMDALGGLRFWLEDTIAIEVAVGGGLTHGWAAPRFEAVAGVSFTPKPFKLGSRRVSEEEFARERADAEAEAAEKQKVKKTTEAFAMSRGDEEPTAKPVEPVKVATRPEPSSMATGTFADADHDGVADADDKCPNEKETINGIKDDDGCPDQGEGLININGSTLKMKTRITFLKGKALFTPGGEELMRQLALTLRARRGLKLKIEVYVTEQSTRMGNEQLSADRAGTIRDFLKVRFVTDEQVDVKGLGVQRPLDPSVVDVTPVP